MKKQKRGKCKLWRSFANIFRRRRSIDATEVPQPPFSAESDFPPLDDIVKENLPEMPAEVAKTMPVTPMKKQPSPVKRSAGPKTDGHKYDVDLDFVGREFGLVNSEIAKGRLKIKPKNRAPGKYNQQLGLGSNSLDRSIEDLVTVHTESNEGSQNSLLDARDDNSAFIPDSGSAYALRNNSGSNEAELSSSGRAAETSVRVALLPQKLNEPLRKIKDEEKEEQAGFRRFPSKKKAASSKSDEAEKSEANPNAKEKLADPGRVYLPISKSQNNLNKCESDAKVAVENAKTTESGTSVSKPETKPKSKKPASSDPRIRLSVSMREVRRSTGKDIQSKADIVNAESKFKASRVESSNLSSSVNEGKFASKVQAESKLEASETKNSMPESKPKALKLEAMLPQQESLQKVSKAEKALRSACGDSKGEKTESNLLEEGEENSFKRPQRRPSKRKADGKKVESGDGDEAVPLGESSLKQGDARRNSVKYSGQKIQESHHVSVDASLIATNSALGDSKKKAESDKETPKNANPVTNRSMLTSVTSLSERSELLTARLSWDQKEPQKAFDESSFQTNMLRDPDARSSLTESQRLTNGQMTGREPLAGSREMLNREGQEEVNDIKQVKNQHLNRISSGRKMDFVSPSILGKSFQKDKDVRSSIHKDMNSNQKDMNSNQKDMNSNQKDMQAATVPEPEIRRRLPSADNINDEVRKRKSQMPDESAAKELHKVFQRVQKMPSSEARNESATTVTEASPATKPGNKSDAGSSSATETGSVKTAKSVPMPPKTFRNDAARKDFSVSQKGSERSSTCDGKIPASANQSANLSSSMNSHSRTASVASTECKIQTENAGTDKATGDVTSSSVTRAGPVVVKAKCPPPVVIRPGKVQPKAVESAKETDMAWIGKAKRMSKEFGDKMTPKVEAKAEEKKLDAKLIEKIENDENFERGGTRSSVKDMIKKIQKQNQAS